MICQFWNRIVWGWGCPVASPVVLLSMGQMTCEGLGSARFGATTDLLLRGVL